MPLFLQQFCPPILWKFFSGAKIYLSRKKHMLFHPTNSEKSQDLDMYWDTEFAEVLENWGKDNTWNEIQLIMSSCKGKVLDIACGTGKTIELLQNYNEIEVYGLDISDLLIEKAIEKGIPKERLVVMSATQTKYEDNEFDYCYSIGSLEHFTEEGIDQFISECARYTRLCAYHMVPISRSEKDEGWLKTTQSFYNNSEIWWQKRFEKKFRKVVAIPSKWEDKISIGRWFVCYK